MKRAQVLAAAPVAATAALAGVVSRGGAGVPAGSRERGGVQVERGQVAAPVPAVGAGSRTVPPGSAAVLAGSWNAIRRGSAFGGGSSWSAWNAVVVR